MKTDNELIAEFIGVAKILGSDGFLWDISQTGKAIYGLQSQYLKYHSSWDWLMPVVQKCSKMQKGAWNDLSRLQYSLIDHYLLKLDIKGVYKETVEFIGWYNRENDGNNDTNGN